MYRNKRKTAQWQKKKLYKKQICTEKKETVELWSIVLYITERDRSS